MHVCICRYTEKYHNAQYPHLLWVKLKTSVQARSPVNIVPLASFRIYFFHSCWDNSNLFLRIYRFGVFAFFFWFVVFLFLLLYQDKVRGLANPQSEFRFYKYSWSPSTIIGSAPFSVSCEPFSEVFSVSNCFSYCVCDVICKNYSFSSFPYTALEDSIFSQERCKT